MIDLQEKTEKRNKVRMMEMESKENINHFWNKKMNLFRINKNSSIEKKMQIQRHTLVNLLKLEKKE